MLDSLPDGPLKADLRQRLTAADSNDGRFASAIGAAPVVLAATAADKGPTPAWPAKSGMVVAGDPPDGFLPVFDAMLLPIAVLADAASGLGATNWLPDRDQVVRRVPLVLCYGDTVVPSLAIEALRVATGASTYVLRGSNASGTTAFGRQTGLNAIKVGDIEMETGADGSIRPRYTHIATGQRYLSAMPICWAGKRSPRMRSAAASSSSARPSSDSATCARRRSTPWCPGVEIQAEVHRATA